MTFSPENLEKRKRFLTSEFYQRLKSESPTVDPFTRTSDVPKAFRVGECKVLDSGVSLNVLLFWKDDTRTDQRSINVKAERIADGWRIASVEN